MAGVAGVQTCPACGSGAVSSQRRTRDPETGKSATPGRMAMVLWGLLALCGVIVLSLVPILLIEAGTDVKVGVLDAFVIGGCIFAIANFLIQLRRFRGRGPDAGLLCWCRDCANEWFVAGQTAASSGGIASRTPATPWTAPQQPAAPIPVPPAAPAQAPAQATAVASNVSPGIPRIMEALKSMPLPEKVRGWNQVISVEITDRPDLRYGWIIDGDRWHVTTGQTMRSTVHLLAKEENLMNRLATGSGVDGYSLEPVGPFSSFGGAMSAVKCRHLVDGMAAYLRAFHQPALQEWLLQRRRKKHGVDAMSQEQLVSALGSGDLETRKAAADALGDQGWAPPPGKDAESYWAAKWDWSKARAAAAESAVASGAWASAQAAPSEVRLAVEYLAGHLRGKDVHKSPAVLQSLVHALVELGPPAVAEIHSQLGQSSNKSCTGDLIEAINLICSGPGPVEPRIKLLAYGGGGLAHLAFRPGQAGLKSALVAAGPAVVDPLIASLHDENVNVRQGAAEVLGRIGDPRATASLAELANDPDSAVRKAAAQAQAPPPPPPQPTPPSLRDPAQG